MFVTTNGNDSNPCTQSQPCAGWDRAYNVAKAGDVISIASGVYGPQAVPAGTKAVTFLGQSGNKVRRLGNDASNITFDGINVDANGQKPDNSAGFENHGAPGAENVTFKNGSIGNILDQKGALIAGDNFTFDNVYFHDVMIRGDGVHLECIYAIQTPGLVVKNSTFQNCGVMDLFFTYGDWWSPQPPSYGDVTIENNVFGHDVNSSPNELELLQPLRRPDRRWRHEELDRHQQHVRRNRQPVHQPQQSQRLHLGRQHRRLGLPRPA